MTVTRTTLGTIVTTTFSECRHPITLEVGMWEHVKLETPRDQTDTQRLRLLTLKDTGRRWP